MANRSPDRTGLINHYNRRRIEADIAVRRAIVRLSKRTDIPPSKAMTVLMDALSSLGVSKRTLQRYWQSDIVKFRQMLRRRYRPPRTRRREMMLAVLDRTSDRIKARQN
jgi:hypothetical protein